MHQLPRTRACVLLAKSSTGRAGPAAGLVVMLVGKGLADGEGVRISACNSVSLQLVGALRWARRSGAAVATGRDSRIGGARGLLHADFANTHARVLG